MSQATEAGYECVMCMESLSGPAPPPPPPAVSNEEVLEGSNNAGAGPASVNAGPSGSGRKKKAAEGTPEYLAEVCGTGCGHLFHRACLDRWFIKTGKKACPSCRKAVAVTKIIRMFLPRPLSEEPLPTAQTGGNAAAETQTTLNLEARSLPPCNCTNEECRQVLSIHEILVKEFNELKENYEDVLDENDVLKAEKASLEEELNKWKAEHASSAANNGSVGMAGAGTAN